MQRQRPRRMLRASALVFQTILLTAGGLFVGSHSQSYTWEDEYLDLAQTTGAEILTLREEMGWKHYLGRFAPPEVIVLKRARGGHSRSTKGFYDASVLWAATVRTMGKPISGTWRERIDCGAGRIGTFLRSIADSSLGSVGKPDVWWPMRPAEVSFFCPGQQVTTGPAPREWAEGRDTTTEAALEGWLRSRRNSIRLALTQFDFELEQRTTGSSIPSCYLTSFGRAAAAVGEAEASCYLSIVSRRSDLPAWVRVGVVRVARDSAWHPLIENGYLFDRSDLSPDRDPVLRLHRLTSVPASLHGVLARALGDPLERARWDQISLEQMEAHRRAASGWLNVLLRGP